MASKASQVDSGASAGTSVDISDKKHGSAAGFVLQTGDVATVAALASTPRDVSPLGQGNINDDALPAGKRRAVSRETPAPPLESFSRHSQTAEPPTAPSTSAPTT